MEPIEYRNDGKLALFGGDRFVRDDRTGYYRNSKRRIRLHQAVWIAEYGEIPDGAHIHHIDGDKNNNGIDNLALMPVKEHLSLHMNAPGRKEFARENIVHAMEAARAWHGSPEGHEWHKKHYEESKASMYVERDYVCEYCGKPFKSTATRSRFCSNACKTYARNASGVDDETRTCAHCGRDFRVNKYARKDYCSKECAAQWRARRRALFAREKDNPARGSACL